MKTSNSGLVLLLLAVVGLAGFLTGNLDRWIAYLFSPTRPSIDGGANSGTSSAAATLAPNATTSGGLVTLGGSSQRSQLA